MQNVTIMHNPYKLTSVIKVNGEELCTSELHT